MTNQAIFNEALHTCYRTYGRFPAYDKHSLKEMIREVLSTEMDSIEFRYLFEDWYARISR